MWAILLLFTQLTWAQKPLVLITHASETWDARRVALDGMLATLDRFKNSQISYLELTPVEGKPSYLSGYLSGKKEASRAGEFSSKVKTNHVIAMGGNWGQCLDQSLDSLMEKWARTKYKNLQLDLISDAIYVSKLGIFTSDSYYLDFVDTLSIYSDETLAFQKMTLKNLLNLIEKYEEVNSYELRADFLMRKLPRYMRLPSEFRVVLKIDEVYKRVIKTGLGETGPTLTIKFFVEEEIKAPSLGQNYI